MPKKRGLTPPRKILRVLPVLAVVLTGALLNQWPGAQAKSSHGPLFVDGELIVELQDGASITDVNGRNGTTLKDQIHGTNFYELSIPRHKSATKWLKRLQADPEVLTASLNPLVVSPFLVFGRSILSSGDGEADNSHTRAEFLAQRQSLMQLSLADSLVRSRGDGIVVAVIDTGVDRTHPGLVSHLWKDTRPNADTGGGADGDHDGFVDDSYGWDFIGNDNDPSEEPAADPAHSVYGHGTFIAGLIALVAPDCKIMPIRAFRPDGTSNEFYVAAGIKYATDHGANIINLSCGSPADSKVLRDAISYARNQGVILAAAVGNQNTDQIPQFPALLVDDVIGVGAVDALDRKAYFSNYGISVSLNAPGVNLISAYPGGLYASWNGTSFSTPLAAAEAALILSVDDDASATRATMENSAVNIDAVNPDLAGQLGKGRIDPLAALQSVNARPVLDLFATLDMGASAVELTAQGQASISISRFEQTFALDVTGLQVNEPYSLFLGDVSLDSADLTTDNFGGITVEFSSLPSSRNPLPAAIADVRKIRHIELRDATGTVILQNDFAPVSEVAAPMPPSEFVEKGARLILPGSTSLASGVARVQVDSDGALFEVVADRLTAGAGYEIFADGKSLGVFIADSGYIGVDFTSNPTDVALLPPELTPAINIKKVELRDDSGQLVLFANFRFGGALIGQTKVKVSDARR